METSFTVYKPAPQPRRNAESQPYFLPAWAEFARLLDEYYTWRTQHAAQIASLEGAEIQ